MKGNVPCLSWTSPQFIVDINGAVAVSAVWTGLPGGWNDSKIILGYMTDNNKIFTRTADITSSGILDWSASINVFMSNCLKNSYSNFSEELELAWVQVDATRFNGSTRVIGLFFSNQNNRSHWYTKASWNSSWADQGEMYFDNLVSPGSRGWKYSPAIVNWPNVLNDGKTCGIFVDGMSSKLNMICYNRISHRWSAMLWDFPLSKPNVESYKKPSISFHQPRRSWGGALLSADVYEGYFILVFARNSAKGDIAFARISETLFYNKPPNFSRSYQTPLFKNWEIFYGTDKLNAGLSLYEDEQIVATKGLFIHNDVLYFLPFADGTYRAYLRGENDFVYMEKMICSSLHGVSYPCN